MAKLQRKTQKIFAGSADADQIAVFGSMKTGTPDWSADVEELQSADYEQGWTEAILNDKAPFLEEMNGVQFGLSYQLAYIFQEGIPEYDANTEYSNTSMVKEVVGNGVSIYLSLANGNIGHALTNTTYWEKILIANNFIQLASSGTINLTTNSTNYITPTGPVVFNLPTLSSDDKLNQILIQVNLTTVYSIDVGTTHYFNGKTPDMSTTGMYNLLYEYDKNTGVWVCGWLRKS